MIAQDTSKATAAGAAARCTVNPQSSEGTESSCSRQVGSIRSILAVTVVVVGTLLLLSLGCTSGCFGTTGKSIQPADTSVGEPVFPLEDDKHGFLPSLTERRQKKHNDDDDDDSEDLVCNDGGYSQRTLKLVHESPMAALFSAYEKKYEASSVTVVNDQAYAICDSSWSIYKFGLNLEPWRGSSNVRFGDPQREDEDSDYEAIIHKDGIFYIVRESIQDENDDTYHAIIEEIVLEITAGNEQEPYLVQRQCPTQYEFEGDSKGFEGVWALRDLEGELFLLGLCEGNHCSEKFKDDRGNGRIIVMKQRLDKDDDCIWETIQTIQIPKSASFTDYSDMAVDENGYIAITSQEDSQLWVGRLLGKQEGADLWDMENLAFDEVSEVFDFPKDSNCHTIYCNIEGIHWLDGGTLLATSDKMKKNGKQDFRCREKDQSVHIFVLP